MLDIDYIRKNSDKIKKNNQLRGCKVSVDKILQLDRKRRELITKKDQMRAQQNRVSECGKPSAKQIKKMRQLKEKIKEQESEIKKIDDQLNTLLIQLPNITHQSTPAGKDEADNQVYKKWSPNDPKTGKIKKSDFKIEPHWIIGKRLDLIDEGQGVKVSGSRFWYLKNELVYLEFALVHYALDFLKQEGVIPILPPMIVRERAMYGTGFFPADENEIYRLANPEYEKKEQRTAKEEKSVIPSWSKPAQYLIGTAEVPLAAYHAGQVLDLDQPKIYCGFSSCFRREAGTYGKDMQGILRGHQFDKIEMFIFASKEDSWKMHEYLLATAERFWQSLKIPYQVLLMCSGDIGTPNAKKYDIEAWMPGQAKYREVVSCSNDTDFQARRLNIKYFNKHKLKEYAHTLNSTLIAIGRGIIAILENYQTELGEIIIPEILKPYMFGIEKIAAKK